MYFMDPAISKNIQRDWKKVLLFRYVKYGSKLGMHNTNNLVQTINRFSWSRREKFYHFHFGSNILTIFAEYVQNDEDR